MSKIGFVGLGTMGLPMSVNLARKSGRPVIGLDVVPERMEALAAAGGGTAADLGDLLSQCDVVFLSLPTDDLMRETVEKIIAMPKPGLVVVDVGSSYPGLVRELHGGMLRAGMHLVDCPVSGGEIAAQKGTLVMMAGGDQDVFESIRALLACMGSRATYMGASGNGSVAKLANNMIVGLHIGAIGEAYAYAVKAGLNPGDLFEAIRGGLADSAVMTLKMPKIISRDMTPSARAEVLQKDLHNAARLAEAMGVDIPLTAMILDGFEQLEAMGKAGEDHCAIFRLYERDMGVEIK